MIYDKSFYRQDLLEDARRPRHFGRMTKADLELEAANPSCGDELTIFLKLNKAGKKILDASFDGRGCMVMMASASRFVDYLSGKPIAAMRKVTRAQALKLFGMPLTPSRENCALMPWQAIRQIKK